MPSILAGLQLDGLASFWGLVAMPVLLAGCAVPLMVLAYVALPPRWVAGLGVELMFLACLLVAPVVLMGGLALGVLAAKPVEWASFEFRSGDPPRMDARWRHMLPSRPGREARDDPGQ